MEKKHTSINFLDHFFSSEGEWSKFYELCFSLHGSPKGLSYQDLLDDPILYDKKAYQFLELTFNPVIEKAKLKFLNSIGSITELRTELVQQKLLCKANWQSVWKQCSAFLGFSAAFGVEYERGIDFLSCFIFSQAIPATAFDGILDECDQSLPNGEWVGVFACLLNACALQLEESKCGIELSKCIRRNANNMYARMVNDAASRRVYSRMEQNIDEYLEKDNGVRASVFFSIGTEGAAILAEKSDISKWCQVGANLSKIRQINDEILDIDEDLHIGSITLPMIVAARDLEYGDEFKLLLRKIWEDRHVASFEQKRYMEILEKTKALSISGSASAGILKNVSDVISREVDPANGFLVCCLIGLRIGVLRRLYLNDWRNLDEKQFYFPMTGGV